MALSKFVLERRVKGGFPPIVVGDFNADPDSTEIRFMSGYASIDGASAMFYDAWRLAGTGDDGITWSNNNEFAAVAIEPDRRIDYIFVGYPQRLTDGHGMGKVLSCRVVCDDVVDGVWPSDHYGVFAELASEPLPRPPWTMG
jgi:endonuclease/exonuclease/phosphatase family metal-dependent hydrolase